MNLEVLGQLPPLRIVQKPRLYYVTLCTGDDEQIVTMAQIDRDVEVAVAAVVNHQPVDQVSARSTRDPALNVQIIDNDLRRPAKCGLDHVLGVSHASKA